MLNLHRETSAHRSATEDFGKPLTDLIFERNTAIPPASQEWSGIEEQSGSSNQGVGVVEEHELAELSSPEESRRAAGEEPVIVISSPS